MTEEISLALTLLLIGMITVFLVLLLVVITGNLLIRIVNKYFPAEISDNPARGSGEIDQSTIAAITAAVTTITGGKGKITKIEKA